ncbi:MAG: AEC family transporter [Phascolarctobacterium sp.]|nr:AEC family transporter [Phascolarctobacterium sp.]
MDIILHSLNVILTVIIMIAAGFIMDRCVWFTDSGVALIARMVNYICLPVCMLANIVSHFDHDGLINMAGGAIAPFLSMISAYCIIKLIAALMKVLRGRRGIFVNNVSFPDIIFIGLPMTIALFGEEGAPYVMVYYMANTTLFWTIGMHELSCDAGREAPLLSLSTLRIIFSPPLMGFFTVVTLLILDLHLPDQVFKSCYYIGSMTSPLAMLFVGIAMSRTAWKEIMSDFTMFVVMVARYLISPMIVILLLPVFNIDATMGRVFVILAAMPVMTNLSIILKTYGGDYKYAAMLVTVSTCLAAGVTPFYM